MAYMECTLWEHHWKYRVHFQIICEKKRKQLNFFEHVSSVLRTNVIFLVWILFVFIYFLKAQRITMTMVAFSH